MEMFSYESIEAPSQRMTTTGLVMSFVTIALYVGMRVIYSATHTENEYTRLFGMNRADTYVQLAFAALGVAISGVGLVLSGAGLYRAVKKPNLYAGKRVAIVGIILNILCGCFMLLALLLYGLHLFNLSAKGF